MNKERLQKVIAANSNYSRRKAEELIKSGKVKVNGETITQMGMKVSPSDEILVEGNVIYHQEKVYFLLNKPLKVVSTCADEHGRRTVLDLVPHNDRIYPVGRLDYYTSGLLLLTNDGTLANGLMHPRKEIPKEYRVNFEGPLTDESIRKLRYGVDIGGYKTARAKVKVLNYNEHTKKGRIQILIHEGKNQQVRRMFSAIGCKVTGLKRVSYAIFSLSEEKLAPGESRNLKPKEVKQLYNLIK